MSSDIDKALALVTKKFHGVTDQDGEPYLMHCLRVMDGVDLPEAQLVGLMHDLVEDTDVTIEDLKQMEFDPATIEAVDLITHREEDSYADYVVKLKPNPLARSAKLSDLRDNGSLGRVLYRSKAVDKDLRRIQRYILSYQFLSDRINESDYCLRMQPLEN